MEINPMVNDITSESRELSSPYSRNAHANRQIISEVKDLKYAFCIYRQEGAYQKTAEQIEVGLSAVSFLGNDDKKISIPYERISVQVFPKRNLINLVERRRVSLRILVLAFVPYLLAFLLLMISLRPDPNPKPFTPWLQEVFDPIYGAIGITRDEVRGFAWAVFLVSLVAMFLVELYVIKSRNQPEERAASTVPQIIEKLNQATDEQQYFSRLIENNLDNMEKYYQLVRTQTEKSYGLTQAAAVVGFMVLVAGIILSFMKSFDNPSTIVTLASGALIEFISAVFFYIYNRTVVQLNVYHEKLINVQDTMLALKVAQIIQDQKLKDETMADLTKALTSRLQRIKATEASMGTIAEPDSSSKSDPKSVKV
jgi:hypothetical protein